MTKHRAIGINPDGAALAANAAEFRVLQSLLENAGVGIRQFALQDDVGPAAGELFRDLVRRKVQALGQQRNEGSGIIDQCSVGHDRRDRDVLGEDFVVRVVDRAPLGRDDVAPDMFFRSQLA